MIRIGILGGAGYTAGELLRLLLNHKEAQICFVNSTSNAGNLVTDVHSGLLGETDLRFTSDMPFDDVDVVFFCFGHGKSREFLSQHAIPERVRIVDLAQDFRHKDTSEGYIYGQCDLNREAIRQAKHIANPGCFATCIELGLLPAAKMGLVQGVVMVNAITGSTGAGQKPGATTHFSWRNNNMSVYKAFTHQHLKEIEESLFQEQQSPLGEIDFIPWRGDFARGIFSTIVLRTGKTLEEIQKGYSDYYAGSPFTFLSSKPIDLKQVVNTNKCVIHLEKDGERLLITSAIDNLLKGAVGQAVENMNLMFSLPEDEGLRLKASAF